MPGISGGSGGGGGGGVTLPIAESDVTGLVADLAAATFSPTSVVVSASTLPNNIADGVAATVGLQLPDGTTLIELNGGANHVVILTSGWYQFTAYAALGSTSGTSGQVALTGALSPDVYGAFADESFDAVLTSPIIQLTAADEVGVVLYAVGGTWSAFSFTFTVVKLA